MLSSDAEDIICEEMQKAWEAISARLRLSKDGILTTDDMGSLEVSRIISTSFESPAVGEIAEVTEVELKVYFDRK